MEGYQLLSRLGSGSFATVWKARRRSDGVLVAVKQLHAVDVPLEEVLHLPEVRHMGSMPEHPNILSLHSVIQLHGRSFMVMDYCEGGDLFGATQAQSRLGRPFRMGDVVAIAASLFGALAHAHACGVLHRDVKPDNCLVCRVDGEWGGAAGSARLVLADWGQAASSAAAALTPYVSTRWYRAPEVLLAMPRYGEAADCFGAALVLAELLLLRPLFPGSSEADQLHRLASTLGPITPSTWAEGAERVREMKIALPPPIVGKVGLAKVLPQSTPPPLLALLGDLLSWNPAKRPTAQEAYARLLALTATGGGGGRITFDLSAAAIGGSGSTHGVAKVGGGGAAAGEDARARAEADKMQADIDAWIREEHIEEISGGKDKASAAQASSVAKETPGSKSNSSSNSSAGSVGSSVTAPSATATRTASVTSMATRGDSDGKQEERGKEEVEDGRGAGELAKSTLHTTTNGERLPFGTSNTVVSVLYHGSGLSAPPRTESKMHADREGSSKAAEEDNEEEEDFVSSYMPTSANSTSANTGSSSSNSSSSIASSTLQQGRLQDSQKSVAQSFSSLSLSSSASSSTAATTRVANNKKSFLDGL